jgi:hypothetical protein
VPPRGQRNPFHITPLIDDRLPADDEPNTITPSPTVKNSLCLCPGPLIAIPDGILWQMELGRLAGM